MSEVGASKFQFHYGSIVSFVMTNTAMILLKFQFHYGSIVRHIPNPEKLTDEQISIPLWFDCEEILRKMKRLNIQFQFHYGSIVRAFKINRRRSKYFISIPLWFDCEEKKDFKDFQYCKIFQFHYGSIVRFLLKKMQ